MNDQTDLANFALSKSVKRVLIIGVSSYLGSALATGLRDELDVIGTFHKSPLRIDGVTCLELNTLDANKVFETVKKFQPEAVIFCPGTEEYDKIQNDTEEADNLHTKAPALYFKMPVANFHFIYLSSDQVFGDSANEDQMPPFSEKDNAIPINVYAQTKLHGEALVRSQARFAHVLRLGEVFGEPFGSGSIHQKRKTWIEHYRTQLEAGKAIKVSDEEYRTPLYVGDFVRGMREYLKKVTPEISVHHMGAKDMVSRYEFIKLMAKDLGLDSSLVGKAEPEAEVKLGRAPRPKNCALLSQKFEKEFDFEFQTCEHALSEFAERLRCGFTRTWT